MILSYTLILPISQLQKQQVMTPQIRPHIEYLIQTYAYSCAHLIDKNLALMKVFNTI